MSIKVRVAPSPTGRLHIGNARAALVNYLFARKEGGHFMLRMDDTDLERSTAEFEDFIKKDLSWLGLKWDSYARQSDRMGRYQEVFEKLKAMGRLYPAYETPEELEIKRKIQLSRGLPPIYDRAALKLSDAEKKKLEAEGHKPHWRFLLKHEAVEWNDLVRGPTHFEGSNLTDPVFFRADLQPVYMLASVVDDGDFAISHVIRGEDHVTNTAVQIQLWQALGFPVPQFGHFAMIVDASGEKFSKRLGSMSLQNLRDEGIEAMAICSLLARLGTSDPVVPRATIEELAGEFDLSTFGRARAKFDKNDLLMLNAKILHLTSYAEVKERLAQINLGHITEEFWNAVRGNLNKLSDIKEWWDVCHQAITPVIEDQSFITEAATLLPAEPWDVKTWNQWVEAVKNKSGRKGKALFMPLRKALTAREHGPELAGLLPFIGRDKSLARLSGKAA